MNKSATPSKEKANDFPADLKSGIENLSGIDMDAVKVHHNSSQPEQLNNNTYIQGNNIHIAPGQEARLPHAGWQKQDDAKLSTQQSRTNIK